MLTQAREGLTLSSDALHAWAARVFQTTGMVESDALLAADVLVAANLRGVDSHGILRLKNYIGRLESGLNNPRPQLRIECDSPAALRVNGDNGVGMVVGAYAMRLAIERAREFGVASVAVYRSSHYGMAAYYPLMAVKADMIGFTCANTSSSMPPWGGVVPFLGTNPLAFAAPGDMVLDMSTTQVSGGKFMIAMRDGKKIPFGWATDRAGNPTDDPQVAWDGLYTPLGGYKGFGLALMVEILSSLLSGAAFGPHVYQPPQDGKPGADVNVGHFFMAIDVARFCPVAEFQTRMKQLADEIHACEPAPGGEPSTIPGERSSATAEQRQRNGIFLPANVVADLEQIGERRGVPFQS